MEPKTQAKLIEKEIRRAVTRGGGWGGVPGGRWSEHISLQSQISTRVVTYNVVNRARTVCEMQDRCSESKPEAFSSQELFPSFLFIVSI